MKTNDFKKMIGNNIFSAVFVKKNGEKRKINCRLGVKKHLKGGTKSYRDEDFNYLCVFDLQKKQYRTINLNTHQYLKYKFFYCYYYQIS